MNSKIYKKIIQIDADIIWITEVECHLSMMPRDTINQNQWIYKENETFFQEVHHQ